MEKMIAKMPETVGTGKVGSVMATATARQAENDGALKRACLRIQVNDAGAISTFSDFFGSHEDWKHDLLGL